MSDFDFIDSVAPSAEPLQHSHSASQIERELKGIFLELFTNLGSQTFDANVLGAAHLGSFDLVRKMVNYDGLILLPGDREEAATRYLYRAWKSGDIQKRGLHFIRTYLQLLFPEQAEVRQMWHAKDQPYGSAFVSNQPRDPYWYNFLGQKDLKLNGAWRVGRPFASDNITQPVHIPDESILFLTSRIEILLGLETIATGVSQYDVTQKSATSGLLDVIRAVIPARLVPVFRFWLRFVLAVQVRADYALLMEKRSRLRYPWCGRVITSETDAKWQLGRDGVMVKLVSGLKLGTFKLGERRGGISRWKLKSCRISSSSRLQIDSVAAVVMDVTKKLGQKDLRLDGSWVVKRLGWGIHYRSQLTKSIELAQQTKASGTVIKC
ncbi:MAG: hypothetical protein ACRC9N_10070 [Aeromonas sp.]